MKQFAAVIAFIIISFYSSSSLAQQFTIKGNIKGSDGMWIYLNYPSAEGSDRTDSALIKKGRFTFAGTIKEPTTAFVYMNHFDFSLPFFIDGGKIKISGSLKNRHNIQASGTELTNQYQQFRNEEAPIIKRRDWYMGLMTSRELADDSAARMWLVDSFYSTYNTLRALVVDFVTEHPNSAVSPYLLYEKFNNEDNIDKGLSLLKTLSPPLQQSYHALQLKQSAKSISKAGTTAPVFTLPDTAGKQVNLSDFKGKIVLLDFWASWCAPCRHENPNIVAQYKKYNAKGFTVVSVSLDNNRNSWLKAIAADGLQWTQLSDLQGTYSEVAELYGVNALPANWLIDSNGNILGKNLFGKDLQEKLEELFK
ncbi:MAG: TlpA disulfide reductase family protein [Chitinophagales bacterium]